MKLTDFLLPNTLLQGVEVSSKKRAFELIGQLVADVLNQVEHREEQVCPIACFSQLIKREKLGSTAIGYGVALPHAKLLEGIRFEKPIAIFLQLATPIEYDAPDHKEVDLIYALVFPEVGCEIYQPCLAEAAQTLSDKALQKSLRLAQDANELWAILASIDK